MANLRPALIRQPFGQQWPDFAEGTADRGTVDAQRCRQHIVRGGVTQVHQRGRKPVDKHEPVLGTGPERALPPARGQPSLLTQTGPSSATRSPIISADKPGHPTLGHHCCRPITKITSTEIHNHARGR